jgi:hypothetical protein
MYVQGRKLETSPSNLQPLQQWSKGLRLSTTIRMLLNEKQNKVSFFVGFLDFLDFLLLESKRETDI